MKRFQDVTEFNVIGLFMTLVFGLILFILFPISNRILGDLFVRISDILSQSSKVFKLRRKLRLHDSTRPPSTELGQEADEYMTQTCLELNSKNYCENFKKCLRAYNPLIYMPFATNQEKKFNLLDTNLTLKWVIFFFGIFLCWFWVIISMYIVQLFSKTGSLNNNVMTSLILAIVSAFLVQPIIFLVVWGFEKVYLTVLKKVFKQYEVRVRPEGVGMLNRSKSGFHHGQEFNSELKSNLGNIILNEKKSKVNPGEQDEVSSNNTTDEIIEMLGEDSQQYNDKEKRNDKSFLEKFTMISCGIVITLGLFAGICCLAISSDSAKVVFIGFCLSILIDIFIFRIILCLIITPCLYSCNKKQSGEIKGELFLQRNDQPPQITEDKLAQPTELKIVNQGNPSVIEDYGNNISIMNRSQLSFISAGEEERRITELIDTRNYYEDFNKLLLNKIYITYDSETADAIIKKWKDISSTNDIKVKVPEEEVWVEAKNNSAYSYSSKMQKQDKLDDYTGENIIGQLTKRTDYREPPNIRGGREFDNAQSKLFKNAGITGQVNSRIQRTGNDDEMNYGNDIDLYDGLPKKFEETKDAKGMPVKGSMYGNNQNPYDDDLIEGGEALNSAKGLIRPTKDSNGVWVDKNIPIEEETHQERGKLNREGKPDTLDERDEIENGNENLSDKDEYDIIGAEEAKNVRRGKGKKKKGNKRKKSLNKKGSKRTSPGKKSIDKTKRSKLEGNEEIEPGFSPLQNAKMTSKNKGTSENSPGGISKNSSIRSGNLVIISGLGSNTKGKNKPGSEEGKDDEDVLNTNKPINKNAKGANHLYSIRNYFNLHGI